jgi:uncharacterized protein GlcG (DUF336 family)
MFCLSKSFFLLALILLLPAGFALDAPVVTSETHPSGVWGSTPIVFKWAAIAGATHYCFVLDSSAETVAPDCVSDTAAFTKRTDVDVPPKIRSGEYFFHIKAVSVTGASATTNYPIKLDVDGPSKPLLSAESLSDGGIELSWGAVQDDASGVKEYEIYRCGLANFGLRDLGVTLVAKVSGISYNDFNNLGQSKTYHYKIRPVDNAGNGGSVSNEVHASTAAKCDLGISFSISLSDDKKRLLLGLSAVDKIAHGGLKATLPDGSEYSFFDEKEPFTDWNSEFDLSQTKEGVIQFYLSAKEFFGDNCDQNKEFIYDITRPVVQFASPKYNDKVSETVVLQVKAFDQGDFKSGIKSVDFFIDENNQWKSVGAGEKKENDLFELEWDSFTAPNGQTKFKAVAVDNANNTVEATHGLFVLNAFQQAVDVNSALAEAEERKIEAQQAVDDLAAKGVISKNLNSLMSEADAALNKAKELAAAAGSNETLAKSSAAEAIALYESAKKAVTVSTFKTGDFIFNKEQVDILLNAAGISGQSAVEAKQLIEKAEPKRQLQVLRVQDNNVVYYKAAIVVSYSLDVNLLRDKNANDVVLRLIEVVPKEFAEYASELTSSIKFNVLRDDPSIEFILTKDAYKKRAITYALKQDLSEQQANKLIEENVVNKFVAPPVFLLTGTAGGFSLPITTELILFISIAAIVVVIIILAMLILRKKKSKSPLGVFSKK